MPRRENSVAVRDCNGPWYASAIGGRYSGGRRGEGRARRRQARNLLPKGGGDGKAIVGRIKLDSEYEDGTCRFRLAGRQARNPLGHRRNRRGTPVEGAVQVDDARELD